MSQATCTSVWGSCRFKGSRAFFSGSLICVNDSQKLRKHYTYNYLFIIGNEEWPCGGDPWAMYNWQQRASMPLLMKPGCLDRSPRPPLRCCLSRAVVYMGSIWTWARPEMDRGAAGRLSVQVEQCHPHSHCHVTWTEVSSPSQTRAHWRNADKTPCMYLSWLVGKSTFSSKLQYNTLLFRREDKWGLSSKTRKIDHKPPLK